MAKRRLTRACAEARAWLEGVAESREEYDPVGRLASASKSLGGRDLLDARHAVEDLLHEGFEHGDPLEADLDDE